MMKKTDTEMYRFAKMFILHDKKNFKKVFYVFNILIYLNSFYFLRTLKLVLCRF
jgi:hypothetical protein